MLGSKRQACVRADGRWRRRDDVGSVGRRGGVLRAVLAAGLIGIGGAPLVAAADPDWDQVANIKEAAMHLAELQRTQGAERAFTFIDACYKTHSLASEYTRAFEACIAQDYLETQILTLIYSRLPPETLKRMGAPSPAMLVNTMGKRVTAAFATYKMPPDRLQTFAKLVDEHGFPIFFQALFPGTKVPVPNALAPKQK
jgi:hypothetical protein